MRPERLTAKSPIDGATPQASEPKVRISDMVSPCPTCDQPPTVTSGVGGYYVACFRRECLANNFAPKAYGIPRKRTRPLACAEWNKKWANVKLTDAAPAASSETGVTD